MWHRYFAAGLVNPLDQMHSENRPSHPELLSWLARDVAANGYDLKRLTRGLVLSKSYSRSSKYDSSLPDSKLFAVARMKPMTPGQLATSLKIAAADPASFEGKKPEEIEKTLEQMESSARGFASLISQPTDNFQIGVGEALLFSNGDRIMREFLTDGGGSSLGRVKLMKEPKEARRVPGEDGIRSPSYRRGSEGDHRICREATGSRGRSLQASAVGTRDQPRIPF